MAFCWRSPSPSLRRPSVVLQESWSWRRVTPALLAADSIFQENNRARSLGSAMQWVTNEQTTGCWADERKGENQHNSLNLKTNMQFVHN